jgi:glycerate 2-kinase
MHVLIAPNAFKNSLSAAAAAEAIRTGLEMSSLPCTITCFPIADGGDGTAALLLEKLQGTKYRASVHDPLGRIKDASFGMIRLPKGQSAAVIEMAEASGLRLLKPRELNPIITSSVGTGELMMAALNRGARDLLLTVGGSATADGGAGILHALGVRFFDLGGTSLLPNPGSLLRLRDLTLRDLDRRVATSRITVLCDVDNPLLGPQGAAAVYGPQKGANKEDVILLEGFLSTMRVTALRITGRDMASVPYGGAAGGTAAGLWAMLGAQLVNGADYFLELTGFDEALKNADLVITGEGSLDAQTLHGKGPFAVASRARSHLKPVAAFAGSIEEGALPELGRYFDTIVNINSEPMKLEQALAAAEQNLIRAAKDWGDQIAGAQQRTLL